MSVMFTKPDARWLLTIEILCLIWLVTHADEQSLHSCNTRTTTLVDPITILHDLWTCSSSGSAVMGSHKHEERRVKVAALTRKRIASETEQSASDNITNSPLFARFFKTGSPVERKNQIGTLFGGLRRMPLYTLKGDKHAKLNVSPSFSSR